MSLSISAPPRQHEQARQSNFYSAQQQQQQQQREHHHQTYDKTRANEMTLRLVPVRRSNESVACLLLNPVRGQRWLSC